MESKIEEARSRKASGNYNCAQAIAATYAPAVGLDTHTAMLMAGAFGAGMGNMEGTCGSLVGAGMIVGAATGDRVRAMQAMKRMMEAFAHRNGSVKCCELKGIATGKPLRGCNGCVADSAEFLEAELSDLIPR